jgi:hypothetical protein
LSPPEQSRASRQDRHRRPHSALPRLPVATARLIREIRIDGHPVDLQPKAFDRLHDLIRNRDRVVDREELMDALGPGLVVTDDSLTQALRRVRRVAGDDGTRQAVIRTIQRRGFQSWGGTWNRALADGFAIQEEIARQVVDALQSRLASPAAVTMRPVRGTSIEAYDLYLRGLGSLHEFGRRSQRFAPRMFGDALELDASYAPAWAGVAISRLLLYICSEANEENRQGAIDAAARAVELYERASTLRPDDYDATVLAAQSYVNYFAACTLGLLGEIDRALVGGCGSLHHRDRPGPDARSDSNDTDRRSSARRDLHPRLRRDRQALSLQFVLPESAQGSGPRRRQGPVLVGAASDRANRERWTRMSFLNSACSAGHDVSPALATRAQQERTVFVHQGLTSWRSLYSFCTRPHATAVPQMSIPERLPTGTERTAVVEPPPAQSAARGPAAVLELTEIPRPSLASTSLAQTT